MIQQKSYRNRRLHLALNDAPHEFPYRGLSRLHFCNFLLVRLRTDLFARYKREIRLYLRSVRSLVNGR